MHSIAAVFSDELQECISLIADVSTHPVANEAFERLRDRLSSENPQSVELLNLLWRELLSARRSAQFWEQICDVERNMTERMAADHFQLQQNYLRLVQEQ